MKSSSQPRVIPIPTGNVKAFLIQLQGSYVLIDTGLPFFEKRIERMIRCLDVKLEDLKAIILTHGHLDHIGCLAYLKARSGATLICHRSIKSALENGGFEKAVPRVLGWKLINPPISALLRNRLRPVHPDWVVDEMLDLSELELNGKVIHTPGHSPGSCSILLESGICLIGDLIRETSPGSYDTGLFYHDRDQILLSLEVITAYKPETIYLSHGSTISGKDLKRFVQQASH